ncbi:unnamed protein product [Symbiodinium sp. KB8]|nr:unnamed protein product [Symbiodinium sp. KB8]
MGWTGAEAFGFCGTGVAAFDGRVCQVSGHVRSLPADRSHLRAVGGQDRADRRRHGRCANWYREQAPSSQLGPRRVAVLEGGFRGWERDRLPAESLSRHEVEDAVLLQVVYKQPMDALGQAKADSYALCMGRRVAGLILLWAHGSSGCASCRDHVGEAVPALDQGSIVVELTVHKLLEAGLPASQNWATSVCWQCVDDAEKRCFEQQDKLQAPSAQPYKAAEYGSEISRNCGRLSFWEALPPGHLDLCRTSPKLGARVLRFLKAAWLRAEPPRPEPAMWRREKLSGGAPHRRSAAFDQAAAAWCRVLDALEQARGTDPQLVPVLRSGDHLMLAFHPCLEGCERQSLQ